MRRGAHPKEEHNGDGPCANCLDPKHERAVALLRGVASLGVAAQVVAVVARSMPDEALAEAVKGGTEDEDARKTREAFEAREQHANESHQRMGAKLAALERERDEWQGKLAVSLGQSRATLARIDGARGRWEWLAAEACTLLLRATNQTPEDANVNVGRVVVEPVGSDAPKKKRGRPQKEPSEEEKGAFQEELAAAVYATGWLLKRAIIKREQQGAMAAWTLQVERGNQFKTVLLELPNGAGPYSREALRYVRANIAASLDDTDARFCDAEELAKEAERRAAPGGGEARRVEARRVELELPPGTIVSRLAQDASDPTRDLGVVGALDGGEPDLNDFGEPLVSWMAPADSIEAGETWRSYEAPANLRVELVSRPGTRLTFGSWSEVAAERRARQGQGELFAKGGAS